MGLAAGKTEDDYNAYYCVAHYTPGGDLFFIRAMLVLKFNLSCFYISRQCKRKRIIRCKCQTKDIDIYQIKTFS